LFGLITSVTSHEVLVTPIVIASLAPSVLDADTTYKASKWSNRLEISIDEIDSFDLVSSERLPRTESELEPLRRIPERDVKSAIAEIIGEPNVPKDWGGEFSDLFTTRLIVGGQRLPTAFLLKGPSQFREMTPASLGKNGDQIVRLFEEPADLLVLQHCHKVHRGIRDTMRAFASRTGNVRLFCIIDGYDTLRLLRAYGKCGLSPSDRLQSVF